MSKMKSKDQQLLEEAYKAIHEKKTAEELRAEIKQMEQNRDEDEEKSFYYNTIVNKLRKQLKELEEAYVLGEDMGSGKYVYVLIDATPYESSVYGIYSDPQIAQRALQSVQQEEGEDASKSRFEIKKVPLNEEPGYNYIPE